MHYHYNRKAAARRRGFEFFDIPIEDKVDLQTDMALGSWIFRSSLGAMSNSCNLKKVQEYISTLLIVGKLFNIFVKDLLLMQQSYTTTG